MTEAEQRHAVVAEAHKWLGTPYRDCAMVRGAGVDCAMLLKAVYEAIGLGPIPVEPYSPQWFLHRSEERYANKVLEYARELVEGEKPQPGDLVLFKFGRCFAHSGIIVDEGWPHIIHAYKQSGCVVIGLGDQGFLADREKRFFTLKTWGTT